MFSVIITCYNEGAELLRAVRSVQNQTCQDYELIVVKDFSNDVPTLEACQQLEAEGIRVLYSKENVGVSVTRNEGVKASIGEWIYTLDGDDELPSYTLEILNQYIAEHPDADCVFGNYELIEGEQNSVVNCSRLADVAGRIKPQELFKQPIILVGQIPIRRAVFNQVGGNSVRYSFSCQDIELQIRLLQAGARFYYLPQTIYKWYRKPSGINSSVRNAQDWNYCMYEHLDFLCQYLRHQHTLRLCKEYKDKALYRYYWGLYAPFYLQWVKYLPWKLSARFIPVIK